MNTPIPFVFLVLMFSTVTSVVGETLPALRNGIAAVNFEEMWAGFDPRAEPLETEILHQWEEDEVQLRVVRFRIGIFKGKKAVLAAVYGFPKAAAALGKQIPGLVQIHGGGQYADYRACLANAKRGYATISIAWAGRINAPGYRMGPAEVKKFWEQQTEHSGYRLTTDWGALDAYHAPARNPGNVFPSVRAAKWTIDPIESPRNSGWFLCALAARRALTFLEQQPEVNPKLLGVYGHSMGGKLTVMAAVDERVKAAAPSCGGISDRYNRSVLFRKTIGDDVSLKQISCPIAFLSPANDFHGRIGNLSTSIHEVQSREWRVTCAPHHNHQDIPEYEVATLLWFDQHLKKTFNWPETPQTRLLLETKNGVPQLMIHPDASRRILSVDVYYTQQGKDDERPEDRESVMHRFWHHAAAKRLREHWQARLPVHTTTKALWAYANIKYELEQPVSGVGYYYGDYTAETFNVSTLLTVVSPEKLAQSQVQATLKATTRIEDFQGDWEKEWFCYRPREWARSTHKLHHPVWQAPPNAQLALEVRSAEANVLVILLDDFAAEIKLNGGADWQGVLLRPEDFKNSSGRSRSDWQNIKRLKLSPVERLRPSRGEGNRSRIVGRNWKGTRPQFRNLKWLTRD